MPTTRPLRFAVGSTNPAKVQPVRAVVTALWPGSVVAAFAIDMPAAVGPMPLDAQVAAGARWRAEQACALGDADFGIGPEGGVAFVDGVAWLTYVCCVWRRDGVCEEAEATRLKLPPRIGEAVRAGEELGPLMDRLTGIPNIGQGTGAVGVLTGDVIPRDDYLRPALAAALAPFLHSEWYGVAPLGAPEGRSRTMPNVPRKPQA